MDDYPAQQHRLAQPWRAAGLTVAYVPPGTHQLRIFVDPTGYPMRTEELHQWQQYQTYCPDVIAGRSEAARSVLPCQLCRLREHPAYATFRLAVITLTYGHLYETRHPTPDWQPGHTYLLLWPDRSRGLLRTLLEAWLGIPDPENPPTFRPEIPDRTYRVTLPDDPQQDPSMVAEATITPSIALGPWYTPLDAQWMSRAFSLQDYDGLLTALGSSREISPRTPKRPRR